LILKKEIPEDKIQLIVDNIKTGQEAQLEEQLFQFKKDNQIKDPEFDKTATDD
jgi:hypothetical protein